MSLSSRDMLIASQLSSNFWIKYQRHKIIYLGKLYW
jgi:hypothetical protein